MKLQIDVNFYSTCFLLDVQQTQKKEATETVEKDMSAKNDLDEIEDVLKEMEGPENENSATIPIEPSKSYTASHFGRLKIKNISSLNVFPIRC